MDNIFISVSDFISKSKKSESTIRKFIEIIKNEYSDFIKKIKNRYYIRKDLLDYFGYRSDYSLDKFIYGLKRKFSSKKEKNNTSLKHHWKNELLQKDWDQWGTINYSGEYSIDDCMFHLYRFNKSLNRHFNSPIEIFISSERNIDRGGYHHHFLLRSQDKRILSKIKIFIDGYFRKFNLGYTQILGYVPELKGLKYILKRIDQVKDGYDYFFTGNSY